MAAAGGSTGGGGADDGGSAGIFRWAVASIPKAFSAAAAQTTQSRVLQADRYAGATEPPTGLRPPR